MDSIGDSHVTTTARAYDARAAEYTDFVRGSLASLPLDRAVVTAFAELARATGGPVADLGCGPGYLAAHLRDLGLQVFGVDASPMLIQHARALYPDVQFSVGSMAALDVADGALGGAVSWYSVIHTPPAEVPGYFAEFHRVLAAEGVLLLGFFESEGGPVSPFDHAITTAYRWPIDELAEIGWQAGFREVGRLLRKPLENERFERGCLFLRKTSTDVGDPGL